MSKIAAVYDVNLRYGIVTALSQALDEPAFLLVLENSYRQLEIGEGLDFHPIGRYWRGEAELTKDWRQALAQAVCLDPQEDFWALHECREALQKRVLRDLPVARWLDWGERCVVLFSPLLSPADLKSWLLPRPDASAQPLK
ncbi:MAG: hypothetical protein V4812_04640, partial [Pseudomonadota bacterium]